MKRDRQTIQWPNERGTKRQSMIDKILHKMLKNEHKKAHITILKSNCLIVVSSIPTIIMIRTSNQIDNRWR